MINYYHSLSRSAIPSTWRISISLYLLAGVQWRRRISVPAKTRQCPYFLFVSFSLQYCFSLPPNIFTQIVIIPVLVAIANSLTFSVVSTFRIYQEIPHRSFARVYVFLNRINDPCICILIFISSPRVDSISRFTLRSP